VIGLKKIPNQKDLILAYNHLQSEQLTMENLVRYFQWSRFDPRLAEIVTEKLSIHWQDISPTELNTIIRKCAWGAVMGVIIENAALLIPKNKVDEFRAWSQCVTYKIKKTNGELFFIGLFRFAGTQASLQVMNANKTFLRWGYFSDAILVNKSNILTEGKTLLSPRRRVELILELAQKNLFFSTADYVAKLNGQISRRTAEADLKKCKFLRRSGNTKGRVYSLLKK
jgi:hypothetical protein